MAVTAERRHGIRLARGAPDKIELSDWLTITLSYRDNYSTYTNIAPLSQLQMSRTAMCVPAIVIVYAALYSDGDPQERETMDQWQRTDNLVDSLLSSQWLQCMSLHAIDCIVEHSNRADQEKGKTLQRMFENCVHVLFGYRQETVEHLASELLDEYAQRFGVNLRADITIKRPESPAPFRSHLALAQEAFQTRVDEMMARAPRAPSPPPEPDFLNTPTGSLSDINDDTADAPIVTGWLDDTGSFSLTKGFAEGIGEEAPAADRDETGTGSTIETGRTVLKTEKGKANEAADEGAARKKDAEAEHESTENTGDVGLGLLDTRTTSEE